MNVRVQKFHPGYDIILCNNGAVVKILATTDDELYATCIAALLNEFRPCHQCGQPVELGAVSKCGDCIEAEIDPMQPNYEELAAEEPMTASADSRDAAGVIG